MMCSQYHNRNRLRQAFQKPLPGLRAHIPFAPEHRMGSLEAPPPPDARPAAVLVLLYPNPGASHFPLIRRPLKDEVHSGQISLPGGSREQGESPASAALREAWEEIGIPSQEVEILGQLSSLYIPRSHYLVTPVVGSLVQRPTFRCHPQEVAELIEAPLKALFDPRLVKRELWELQGMHVEVPFYRIGPHKVWGATAMILSELAMMLEGE